MAATTSTFAAAIVLALLSGCSLQTISPKTHQGTAAHTTRDVQISDAVNIRYIDLTYRPGMVEHLALLTGRAEDFEFYVSQLKNVGWEPIGGIDRRSVIRTALFMRQPHGEE